MYYLEERISRLLEELSRRIEKNTKNVEKCEILNERLEYLSDVRKKADWKPFEKTSRWGGVDQLVWFRFEIVPSAVYRKQPLFFRIKTGREEEWYPGGPQYMVYVNGIMGHGMDLKHLTYRLSDSVNRKDMFSVYIQAFSGVKEKLTEMNLEYYSEDPAAAQAYFDIKTAYDAAQQLDKNSKDRYDVMKTINAACNLIAFQDKDQVVFHQSLEKAHQYLKASVYGRTDKTGVTAYAVGHTHLDVAWLWTVEDTRRKAARTFANTVELMKRYQNYTFTMSQPAVYQFVEEDFPALFSQAAQLIADKRWEPEGAMWIEPDCNLPSGESFVRQLMFGKKYLQDKFGYESKVLWLPDTFGFSAALPQILKKAGVPYFATTKLSWNDTNRFPNDVFRWRGIDGTEILGYFTNQHAAYLGAEALCDIWKDNKQKELINSVLVPFGWGDAGGGPTEEMLETGTRLESGVCGSPELKMSSLAEFMEHLKEEVWDNKRLPVWYGELYLEMHRGTYTSNAKSKRYNRKSELLLLYAESLAVLGLLLTGTAYPEKQLRQCWERVLLNQFHDILPGSAIKEVYDTSYQEYESVLAESSRIISKSTELIAKMIHVTKEAVIVFNPLGFKADSVVRLKNLPQNWKSINKNGNNYPIQRTENGDAIFFAKEVPAKGYGCYYLSQEEKKCRNIQCIQDHTGITVETPWMTAKINHNGQFTQLYDKNAEKKVLQAKEHGNRLILFEDMPIYYNDAWDIAGYYDEKSWFPEPDSDIVIVENGDVRTVLRIKLKTSKSMIVQDIIFYEMQTRIDFVTNVSWNERFAMLKVEFPVNIHADMAAYEIQFGHLKRPTYQNTSWEAAKFEVCGHKWADISQEDYGVSLLNDCKYGYDIKDGRMRLTLLKAPEYPDSESDQGEHHFIYSLYMHGGRMEESSTVKQGYLLNNELIAVTQAPQTGAFPENYSLINADSDHVIIESVKLSEDKNGIIVRLYEAFNRSGAVKLHTEMKCRRVYECSLLEQKENELFCEEGTIRFQIRPFEIKTFYFEADKTPGINRNIF